jgi:hypothetical protein
MCARYVAVAVAIILAGCGSMYVDGVPAYGKVQEVSAADIKQALANVSSTPKVFSGVTVLNRNQMRVYLRPPFYGYVAAHRTDVTGWGGFPRNVYELEVLRVIKNADDVYVFPLPRPLQGQRDDKHARLLDPKARREISALLGDERSWFIGG